MVATTIDDFGAKTALKTIPMWWASDKKYENVKWQLVIKKLAIRKLAKHQPKKPSRLRQTGYQRRFVIIYIAARHKRGRANQLILPLIRQGRRTKMADEYL